MRTMILTLNLLVLALVGQGEASDARVSEQVRSLDRDWERYEGEFRHDYDAASTDEDRTKIQGQFEASEKAQHGGEAVVGLLDELISGVGP